MKPNSLARAPGNLHCSELSPSGKLEVAAEGVVRVMFKNKKIIIEQQGKHVTKPLVGASIHYLIRSTKPLWNEAPCHAFLRMEKLRLRDRGVLAKAGQLEHDRLGI